MVLNDVRNGGVSLRRARDVYGVEIDQERLEVDLKETNKLRAILKKKETKSNKN